MTEYEYNIMRKRHCEALVRDTFHLHLPVEELLFDDIVTGVDSYAVLFRSKRDLYALFVADNNTQTLGDVKDMMHAMGITPAKILPPHADPQYFIQQAKKHVDLVYPALKITDPSTIRFHQAYAPYAPGLVRIAAISSPIRRYIPQSSRWQSAFDYSFQRIPVS